MANGDSNPVGAHSHIQDLELTNRSLNALRSSGIRTVGELCAQTPNWLLKNVDGLGEKSLREIEELLAIHGLTFGAGNGQQRGRWVEVSGESAYVDGMGRVLSRIYAYGPYWAAAPSAPGDEMKCSLFIDVESAKRHVEQLANAGMLI